MTSLASLATELLTNIVGYVDVLRDFAEAGDSPGQPTLKNLSLSCHRLHAICFPYVFRSLRLRLRRRHAQTTIDNLRHFINRNNLRKTVSHFAIDFGNEWNTGKIGLELKKFLWEIQIKSLTLKQARQDTSIREKSAKWCYFLDTIEALRIQTVDDDNELKMLLLRVCPAQLLHVEDGSFRDMYDDDAYYHHNPHQKPAAAFLKPSVFPNLTTVVYTATWPSYHRFDNFLEFVSKLPVIRHFSVTLMGGEDTELQLEKKAYRVSGDAVRYREIIAAYQILAGRVEGMERLLWLVIGDTKIPFVGDTEPPPSFIEVSRGVYRRRMIDEEVDFGGS